MTTKRVVSDLYIGLLKESESDPELRDFLGCALNIGVAISTSGTRYIGMGGRQDVQYGREGAAKAVAYLYGIGGATGLLTRNSRLDREMRRAFEDTVGVISSADRDAWTSEGVYYGFVKFEAWKCLAS